VVVLAAKGGVDVEALRAHRPRLAEVPFDSAARYMASIHHPVDRPPGVAARLFAKGAPDVLVARASHAVGPDGARSSSIDEARAGLEAANAALAEEGLRVLAVAARDVTAGEWTEVEAGGDPAGLVRDLTILALVGIVDPPREEARHAIAEARAAGIDVIMITGDHASTASAVGRDLGLAPAGAT
jgi:P-type Ca2+ transporter type 2C